MRTTACISEIFSSPQGEGAYLGVKMTFVRLSNCSFGCQWCDTDHSGVNGCRVFREEGDEAGELLSNPLSITQLNELLDSFSDDIVSITGGEPLEQTEFLSNFLPALHAKRKILLETNGIHHEELVRIAPHVDIISMDIKLPSSTGKDPFWHEHSRFLQRAIESGKEVYIKLVVTSKTTDKDITEAIKLISGTNRYIPVFIQPVTPTDAFPEPISDDRLHSVQRLFGAWLPNVKVTPQMHKVWGVR